MEVRNFITNHLYYCTGLNPNLSFMVIVLVQDSFPKYGLVGTMHNRCAFLPIEGRMLVADKPFNIDQFRTAFKLNDLDMDDCYTLLVYYETIRLGYIGKAAMLIADSIASYNAAMSFYNTYSLSKQLKNILKDVEENIFIANLKEKMNKKICPICDEADLTVFEEKDEYEWFECGTCNTKFKYYFNRNLLTVPARTFVEVLETLNDVSTTFVL